MHNENLEKVLSIDDIENSFIVIFNIQIPYPDAFTSNCW
jgi:hypothetical protein